MEKETFSNHQVASLMNEHFIAIKVDREEHPDVDNAYMDFIMETKGNGGWPLNCILMPDGKPLYAGTYFKPIEWMQLLNRFRNLHDQHPESLVDFSRQYLQHSLELSQKTKKGDFNFIGSFSEWSYFLDIKNGGIPTFVNATAGTTVLGAFDPIDEIAVITEKYNIWLHVDGAYCGSVIFSDKYKHLIKGVERSDSFSYNAHKMLGTPLTCSIILVNDKKQMHESFSNEADYLYQTDGDDFNLGKTSFQCGRRNDALKFWTLWKSVGAEGLEKIIDQQFELATVARDYVSTHKDYTLYSFDDSISICFNYKNIDPMLLCTTLYEHQITVVGFGSFNEDTFVRLVTINANNSKQDILNFFKVLEEFVENHSTLLNEKLVLGAEV